MTNKIILLNDNSSFTLCILLSQLWLMITFICASLDKFIFVIFSVVQAIIWSGMAVRELRKKYKL